MALSYEATKAGIKFYDASDVLARIKEAFQIAFPNLDVGQSSTPQGQLINAISEEIISVRNDIADFISAMYLGGYGSYLDIWANTFFSIQRQQATPMIVNVKVKGQPNTIISKDFKAQTSDNKFTFINISGDVTIDKNGEANIQMQSVELGANQILSNTLNKILTPQIGVEVINNEANSTLGSDIESDEALRKRCINSFANRAVSTFESMLSAVRNVRNVVKCVGYENDTENEVTYKGAKFPAHSVSLYVLGGDTKDIGEAMLRTKAPGCYTNGNISESYTFLNSVVKYTMRFSRPNEVLIGFKVQVKTNEFSDFDFKVKIENAILDYLQNIQNISDDVIPAEIVNTIEMPHEVQIISLEAYRQSETDSAKSIEPIILNYGDLATSNLTLIEVVDITSSGS